MRVLYIAYRVPHPPDKGERIRAHHQIRQLAARGPVHLVSPVRPSDSQASLDELAAVCASVHWVPDSGARSAWREIGCLARGLPRSLGTHQPAGLVRAVAGVLENTEVDVVLASTIYAAEVVRPLQGVARVVDLVDVLSDLWQERAASHPPPRSWLDRIEARRLARYEARLVGEVERVVLSSEAECASLRRFAASGGGGAAPVAVGNGVDLAGFVAGEPATAEPVIVFTGSMDYFPNVDAVRFFCTEVLPLVREAVPEVRFQIVGRDPTRAVRVLAADASVQVTGAVDDVRPWLAGAAIAVAPLRQGRGVQNKVLEALAMGLPVVATSVALAGLDHADRGGCAALVAADRSEDIAQAVIDLLHDPQRRARLTVEARALVERSYRWEDQGARLAEVLEAAVRAAGSRPH